MLVERRQSGIDSHAHLVAFCHLRAAEFVSAFPERIELPLDVGHRARGVARADLAFLYALFQPIHDQVVLVEAGLGFVRQ